MDIPVSLFDFYFNKVLYANSLTLQLQGGRALLYLLASVKLNGRRFLHIYFCH